ncbi:helix-turn-helix domain-containing protein [Sphingobacterium sp. LRF_L2]|uniref:helix-turn-helix domain-containing protein n=1 Tax=Sphingobacterium sp. LRF_L2 TaxID=3369421 RepID=UPI003F603E78
MKQLIPIHHLEPDEFFLLERIESADESGFRDFHRHNFYEILWFTDVEHDSTHSIDFEQYAIQKNDVFILSPHQVHTMDVGAKKGFLLPIAIDFFESLFFLKTDLMIFPYFLKETLDQETSQTLLQLISLIEKEYSGLRRRELLEVYMQAFIIHLKPNKTLRSKHKDKVLTILQLINKHFKSEIEVDFYANEVHLSKRRINELMVEFTGQTVKQHIINRLVIAAKRYMGIQHLSMKEIAYELGFNSPAYFSRLFKSKTGFTPEEFKRKHTANS